MKPDLSDLRTIEGPYQAIIEKGLGHARIATYTGAIDDGTAHYLSAILRHLTLVNHKPITLYLNTPGGNVTAGFAIYDLITQLKKETPINIVATGECCSLGPFILQAATQRLSTPRTIFLLHELQAQTGGNMSALQDQVRFYERTQGVLNKVLAGRMGISEKQLFKLFARKDYYLSAEEALNHKLIDKIIEE